MTDNPVFEASRTVLAVREYSDQPIPDQVLHEILEAARLTASGMNKQPWQFVLVRDKAGLAELGRLVTTGPYIAGAAAAIVVAHEKGNAIAVTDVSRAIQSMVLTAWGRGVGSNWSGFTGLDAVREFVGLLSSYEVIGVVPLGYPLRKLGLGKKNRKPLNEVASEGKFGQPVKV